MFDASNALGKVLDPIAALTGLDQLSDCTDGQKTQCGLFLAGVVPIGRGGHVAKALLDAESEAGEYVARGGVYTLRDPETGAVVRTGRARNLRARERAHLRNRDLSDFEFKTEYRTDVYAEQRGLEQLLYIRYPEARTFNGGFNKIRAISPRNPRWADYLDAAFQYLYRGAGQ